MTREGTPVRYVAAAIFLGDDEVCFHLYEAASPELVQEASRRAAIPIERVTEALDVDLDAAPNPEGRSESCDSRRQELCIVSACLALGATTATTACGGGESEAASQQAESSAATTAAAQPSVEELAVEAAPTVLAPSERMPCLCRSRARNTESRGSIQSSGEIDGDPISRCNGAAGVVTTEGELWVVSRFDNTVTRIDSSTNEIVGKPIAVGARPMAIAAGAGSVWTFSVRTARSVGSMRERARCSPRLRASSGAAPGTRTTQGWPWAMAPCGSPARRRARSSDATHRRTGHGRADRGRSRPDQRRRRRRRGVGHQPRQRLGLAHRHRHRGGRQRADRARRPARRRGAAGEGAVWVTYQSGTGSRSIPSRTHPPESRSPSKDGR